MIATKYPARPDDSGARSAQMPATWRDTIATYAMVLLVILLPCIFTAAAHGQTRASIEPAAGSSVREIATSLTGFTIPFQINADNSAFIEVQLFVSRDLGRTWQFVGRQATDSQEFPFYADGDGEYWFALKTLSRDRRLLPEGNAEPELKITVDTADPEMTATVETDAAGRIVCSWDARDANIDKDTFRILYQPVTARPEATAQQWLQVPYESTAVVGNGIFSDSIAWWPDTGYDSLNIRIEVSDSAGNVVSESRRVNVPQVSWRRAGTGTVHGGQVINPRHSGMYPPSEYDQSSYPPVGWNGDESTDVPQLQTNQNSTSPVRGPYGSIQSRVENERISDVRQRVLSQNGGYEFTGGEKPDNVICENGVCRRIESEDVAEVVPGNARRGPATPADGSSGVPAQVTSTRPRIGSPPEEIAPPVPPSLLRRQPMQSHRPAARDFGTEAGQPLMAQSPVAPPVQPQNIQENNEPGAPAVPWESTTLRGPDQRAETSGSTSFQSGGGFNGVAGSSQPNAAGGNYRSNPGPGPQPASQPATQLPAPDGMFVSESTTARPRPGQDYFPERQLNNRAGQVAGTGGQPLRDTPLPNAQAVMPQAPPANGQSPRTQQVSDSAGPVSVMPPFHQPAESDVIPVNTKRFRLNYSIDAIDPSGVERVDLWVTFDGGQTWQTWGTDPDGMSPFPVEVSNAGLYAFRIVVHSRDGLTGRAPMRGDKPDMWINVDVEAPVVQITSVPYGRGTEAGRLVINWEASDPYLTLRPITIRYSVDPRGPWTTIETGLRNSGRYLWRPGP
ncbi:MAG: hypothetical protein AAF456_16100, partial [Planctomycetota bacterium]